MNYQKKSFSVAVGSKLYSDNWEKIFGKKDKKPTEEKKEDPSKKSEK